MSISSEIQRLQIAKADIKTAIENKGVTVGDGTIDTYAKFIDEIVIGSGKNYVEGTVTFVNTDIDGPLIIEHNLGVVPTLFLLLPDYEVDYTVNAENAAIIVSDETLRSLIFSSDKSGINFSSCFETRASYGSYGAWFTVQNGELTDTVATLPKRSASYDYRAGVPYKWIAVSTQLDNTGGGSGDYDQGYEDGKNSVVDLSKLCWKIHFNDLNIFGKSEVVLDLDNVTSLNSFYIIGSNNNGVENTTVEKLTINCKKPITDMYYAFNGSINTSDETLKTLVLNIDTSKNTSLTNGFLNMRALENIEGTPLDFSSCTNLNQPFRNCSALKNFRVKPNTIKIGFGVQYSPNLSTETIQSIIDGLADLTGGTAQALTLHATVGGKLTDEQKATITAKNWELVY